MQSPDQWVWDELVPAMEKAGITDQNEQIAEARKMFPGTSSDLVAKLITQKASLQNHATLYGNAQGLNATETNKSDPFTALNSLTTSLSNFAGALTSPAMDNAASILSSMSSAIGGWADSLSKFSTDNPTTANLLGDGAMTAGATAGVVGTYGLLSGLMNGFGLGTSAVALDGSAAALMAAAAELSAAAGVGAAAKGTAATAATAGAGSAIWAAGAAAAPWVAGAAAVGGGLDAQVRRGCRLQRLDQRPTPDPATPGIDARPVPPGMGLRGQLDRSGNLPDHDLRDRHRRRQGSRDARHRNGRRRRQGRTDDQRRVIPARRGQTSAGRCPPVRNDQFERSRIDRAVIPGRNSPGAATADRHERRRKRELVMGIDVLSGLEHLAARQAASEAVLTEVNSAVAGILQPRLGARTRARDQRRLRRLSARAQRTPSADDRRIFGATC